MLLHRGLDHQDKKVNIRSDALEAGWGDPVKTTQQSGPPREAGSGSVGPQEEIAGTQPDNSVL
jgi:hypothetical protein